MHLIDKSGTKILPDRGSSAADPDILSFRSVNGSFQCGMNTISDEVEGSSSVHGDGCAWVMRENKDWSVIGRIVSPPTLPCVIGPGAADRSKHVAAKYACADAFEAHGEIIVNPGCAAILTGHLLKGTRGKKHVVQRSSADA